MEDVLGTDGQREFSDVSMWLYVIQDSGRRGTRIDRKDMGSIKMTSYDTYEHGMHARRTWGGHGDPQSGTFLRSTIVWSRK